MSMKSMLKKCPRIGFIYSEVCPSSASVTESILHFVNIAVTLFFSDRIFETFIKQREYFNKPCLPHI